MHSHFPALNAQRLVQRNRFKIFHRHLFGECYDFPQLVHLAHGVIEDARDNASVTVPGRARVAVTQIEVADKPAAFRIERENQAHALGIVGTADEAGVLARSKRVSFVAMHLTGHERIVADKAARTGAVPFIGLWEFDRPRYRSSTRGRQRRGPFRQLRRMDRQLEALRHIFVEAELQWDGIFR